MADHSKAAQYLESLQKEIFAQTGAPFDDSAWDDEFQSWLVDSASQHLTGLQDAQARDELRDFMAESLARARRDRPTRFEDPALYSMMCGFADHLEASARKLGLPVGDRPVFGTLPVGRLNAMAIRVPESAEHIIVFQHGVFGFVNLVTKAVAAAFPVRPSSGEHFEFSTDLGDVDRSLQENPEPVGRLADFLLAYVMQGDPHQAEQYFLPDPHAGMAGIFREAAETFIMGHEYGHITAGHLTAPEQDVEQQLGDTTVEVLPLAWRQEIEADHIGMALTVQTMHDEQGMDLALSYIGIDLLFSTMDVVERAMGTLLGLDPTAVLHDSHPPPFARRDVMRNQLKEIGAGPEAAEAAVKLAETATATLNRMWDQVEPYFGELHRRGERPAPIWSV